APQIREREGTEEEEQPSQHPDRPVVPLDRDRGLRGRHRTDSTHRTARTPAVEYRSGRGHALAASPHSTRHGIEGGAALRGAPHLTHVLELPELRRQLVESVG